MLKTMLALVNGTRPPTTMVFVLLQLLFMGSFSYVLQYTSAPAAPVTTIDACTPVVAGDSLPPWLIHVETLAAGRDYFTSRHAGSTECIGCVRRASTGEMVCVANPAAAGYGSEETHTIQAGVCAHEMEIAMWSYAHISFEPLDALGSIKTQDLRDTRIAATYQYVVRVLKGELPCAQWKL